MSATIGKRTLAVWVVILIASAVFVVARGAAAQLDNPAPDEPTLIPPISSASFRLFWSVMGNGDESMASTSFQLRSTLGQPVIGTSASASFGHHAGYWQRFPVYAYLPIILKP